MTIEKPSYFNEPVDMLWQDVVPRTARFRLERLPEIVRARLELESRLRICGSDAHGRDATFALTRAHHLVLVKMLTESESPLSSSLRAAAAAAAGALKLKQAVPLLRAMAIDENEDRRTRLNAISSYFASAPKGGTADLKSILRSRDALARSMALVAAMETGSAALRKVALAHLRRERDSGVRAQVHRRVNELNMATATLNRRPSPVRRGRRGAR